MSEIECDSVGDKVWQCCCSLHTRGLCFAHLFYVNFFFFLQGLPGENGEPGPAGAAGSPVCLLQCLLFWISRQLLIFLIFVNQLFNLSGGCWSTWNRWGPWKTRKECKFQGSYHIRSIIMWHQKQLLIPPPPKKKRRKEKDGRKEQSQKRMHMCAHTQISRLYKLYKLKIL